MIQLYLFLLLIPLLLAGPFQNPLKFSSTGDFTILHLTDLHYCQSPDLNEQTRKLQDNLIQQVNPDVVIVTGDIINSVSNSGLKNSFQDCWRKFVKPFSDNRMHYILTLGPQDLAADLKLRQIADLERSSQYSLYSLGNGNVIEFTYTLPIASSFDKDKAAANLWIFNSNGIGCLDEPNSWGCVDPRQVKWYEEYSQVLQTKQGEDVHNIAFMHQPLPEFMTLYNSHEYYGNRNEQVSCPLMNTELFEAFKNRKDMHGVFVGHDHLNDYGGWVDNIELVYGRKTGYGGGLAEAQFQKGGRVIKLKEEKDPITGKIKVHRRHHVIVESIENGTKKLEIISDMHPDMSRGKHDLKQEVCRIASSREPGVVSGIWIAVAIMLIAIGGVICNHIINTRVIEPFEKKERRENKISRPQKVQNGYDMLV